jgi:hypothetical protein
MKDEALKMAKEAGFWKDLFAYPEFKDHVEAFAKLVAAAARPTSGEYALGYAEGFNDACNPAQQCLDCGSNNIGIPATYDSLIDSVKTSQENT